MKKFTFFLMAAVVLLGAVASSWANDIHTFNFEGSVTDVTDVTGTSVELGPVVGDSLFGSLSYKVSCGSPGNFDSSNPSALFPAMCVDTLVPDASEMPVEIDLGGVTIQAEGDISISSHNWGSIWGSIYYNFEGSVKDVTGTSSGLSPNVGDSLQVSFFIYYYYIGDSDYLGHLADISNRPSGMSVEIGGVTIIGESHISSPPVYEWPIHPFDSPWGTCIPGFTVGC